MMYKTEMRTLTACADLQVQQLKHTSREVIICVSLGDKRHFQANIIEHHFIVTFVFTADWIVLMTFHLN